MAEPGSPRQPPQYRPFRVAAYSLHIALSGFVAIAVIISTFQSACSTPRVKRQPDQALPVAECLAQADALWAELDQKRQGLAGNQPASKADHAWAKFRLDWLQRHRMVEARCAGEGERAILSDVYRRLDHAMDLYTTHAVQYSGEVGPSVDKLKAALQQAHGVLP